MPGAAIYMYDDFENTCSGNGRRLQEAGRRLQGDTCGNVLQSAMGSLGDFATACVCTSCTSCTSGLTIEGHRLQRSVAVREDADYPGA